MLRRFSKSIHNPGLPESKFSHLGTYFLKQSRRLRSGEIIIYYLFNSSCKCQNVYRNLISMIYMIILSSEIASAARGPHARAGRAHSGNNYAKLRANRKKDNEQNASRQLNIFETLAGGNNVIQLCLSFPLAFVRFSSR